MEVKPHEETSKAELKNRNPNRAPSTCPVAILQLTAFNYLKAQPDAQAAAAQALRQQAKDLIGRSSSMKFSERRRIRDALYGVVLQFERHQRTHPLAHQALHDAYVHFSRAS